LKGRSSKRERKSEVRRNKERKKASRGGKEGREAGVWQEGKKESKKGGRAYSPDMVFSMTGQCNGNARREAQKRTEGQKFERGIK